jgi:hypothetical protein
MVLAEIGHSQIQNRPVIYDGLAMMKRLVIRISDSGTHLLESWKGSLAKELRPWVKLFRLTFTSKFIGSTAGPTVRTLEGPADWSLDEQHRL